MPSIVKIAKCQLTLHTRPLSPCWEMPLSLTMRVWSSPYMTYRKTPVDPTSAPSCSIELKSDITLLRIRSYVSYPVHHKFPSFTSIGLSCHMLRKRLRIYVRCVWLLFPTLKSGVQYVSLHAPSAARGMFESAVCCSYHMKSCQIKTKNLATPKNFDSKLISYSSKNSNSLVCDNTQEVNT
jgi:hypothetical protein